MSDIALIWSPDIWRADLGRDAAGALLPDGGLKTAVIISLFTDRRANDTDQLPGGAGADKRGWWGDAIPMLDGHRIGSRLWLLHREKRTPRVLARAEEYAREALSWMVETGLASAVEVTAETTAEGWLGLHVRIHRPEGPVAYQFDRVWQEQEAA